MNIVYIKWSSLLLRGKNNEKLFSDSLIDGWFSCI